jgi:hypothetical protein
MSKNIEFGMGIGDINEIMGSKVATDLSWLDVNEEDYRKLESLPKQNFDIIEDIQNELSGDFDTRSPKVAFNKSTDLLTNNSPLDSGRSDTRVDPEVIRINTAKLLMSGHTLSQIREKLSSVYSREDILNASSQIKEVLAERGLLGNIYINSSHFPRCSDNSKEQKFAREKGKRSLFILSKDKCSGCINNRGGVCSSLGSKKLVATVPYTKETFAHYYLSSKSDNIQFPQSGDFKSRLRTAFINGPVIPARAGTFRTYSSPIVHEASDAEVSEFIERKKSEISFSPSHEYLKLASRMMLGYDDLSQIESSTDSSVLSLSSEFGILGHTYLDMDVLGGCKNTLALIKKKNLRPDYVISRNSSCSICDGHPDGGCCQISKITRISREKIPANIDLLVSSIDRAEIDGRISSEEKSAALSKISSVKDFASSIRYANLRVLKKKEYINTYSGPKLSNFSGSSENMTPKVRPEEFRRHVSGAMNMGLRGSSLKDNILSVFSRDDISHLRDIAVRLSSDEGVQGFYHIDPTAYPDYGSGCSTGSSKFRGKGPVNVLASSNCMGCSLQSAPGWCSKYGKNLIRSVSSEIRSEYRKIVSLPVISSTNSNDPSLVFGLRNQEMGVPEKTVNPALDIEFNGEIEFLQVTSFCVKEKWG